MRSTKSLAVVLSLVVLLASGAAEAGDDLQITKKPHAEWTQDLDYAQSLSAEGGVEPYAWSVDDENLPAGLTLTTSGDLSGTPGEAGEFEFTITVRDMENVVTTLAHEMKINDRLDVLPIDLPARTVDQYLSCELHASGGTGTHTWSKISGSLPPGVDIESSGVLSGVPEESGIFTFDVEVADSLNATSSMTMLWVINTAPEIGKLDISSWTVERPFTASIPVKDGTPPYEWVFGGEPPPDGEKGDEPGGGVSDLPAGVDFRVMDYSAEISGTPTESGEFFFIARVKDSCGVEVSGEFELTIAKWPTISSGPLPTAVAGIEYSTSINVAGGTAPVTFRILEGELPDGLSLDQGGEFSGTPAETGEFAVSVVAEDASGATVADSFTIVVMGAIEIDDISPPEWTEGCPIEPIKLTASGGDGDISWSTQSSLPTGVYLYSDGRLIGNPKYAGTHEFDIAAQCGAGSKDVIHITWTVNPKPEILTEDISEWVMDRPFSTVIDAEGGTEPVMFEVASGELPGGLTLDESSREISGIPTQAGTYVFTLVSRDARGATDSKTFETQINVAPKITDVEIDWTSDKYFSRSFTGNEYIAPQQWRLSSGEVPPGLYMRLDGLDAQLHGTPSETGKYEFSIDFEDETGTLERVNFNLTINPALTASEPEYLLAAGRETNTFLPLTGGTPPITWAVVSGTMPPGLTFDSDTGCISGTPEVPGTFEFAVFVQDACQTTSGLPVTLHIAERLFSQMKKESELVADDSFRHYWFDALEGSQIKLNTKLNSDGAFPTVTMLDADGNPIPLGDSASESKRGFRIKNFRVSETERYYIRIDNRAAQASGQLKLKLTIKPPTRFSFEGDLTGPGDTDVVAIPLPAGTMSLKVGADGQIDPGAMVLETPDGDLISLAALGSLRAGEKRFHVKRLSIPASGVYRLHINLGSEGHYRATIRVRTKLPHTCRLPE